MTSNMNTPRWDRNLQYQQRRSNQQSRQQRVQQRNPNDFGGFDSLVVGRKSIIKLGNGEVIRGDVSAASKYWYLVNVDGQVVIINKGYIISIMPVQSQNKNENAGTPVGTTVNPYGEEKK